MKWIQFITGIALAGAIGFMGIPPTSAYEETPVPDGASVSGKVTFKGAPPPPKLFELAKFPQPQFCGKVDNDTKGNRIVRQVIVGKDGALKDVVVFIKGIEKGKPFNFSGTDIKADTCRFLVQGPSSFVGVVMKKGEFRVENMDADPSDPKSVDGVLHNPHTYNIYDSSSRTIFNKPLPTKGQKINYTVKPIDLKKSNIMFLQCDQHNFMEAHFYAIDNPYYAVVGEDGSFNIDGIPPGKYKVSAWHPMMGTIKEQEVTLIPKGTASVKFEFAAAEIKGGPEIKKEEKEKKEEKGEKE